MQEDVASGSEKAPKTAPDNFVISIRGFDTQESAEKFGQVVGLYIQEISRAIDLSGLDGITIANDYKEALLSLDRGYETSHKLTPTDGDMLGVAMTPAVIREGKVKSHILLNAFIILPLANLDDDNYEQALHTLTHECAHVEVNNVYDKSFPGELLQKVLNFQEGLRWQVIKACWEEYAATWISAPFGRDPTNDYEEMFLLLLSKTRDEADNYIKEYRLHGNVDRVVGEVYGTYGNLMKFACYLLGNLFGRKLTLNDLPRTKAALAGHWFEPAFMKLDDACNEIIEHFGQWKDKRAFEKLGDIVDELAKEGGIILRTLDDGSLHADIPFTSQTMPEGDPSPN